jgi:hypothetical protein
MAEKNPQIPNSSRPNSNGQKLVDESIAVYYNDLEWWDKNHPHTLETQ